jgi:Protein of unknown function (DUF1302)
MQNFHRIDFILSKYADKILNSFLCVKQAFFFAAILLFITSFSFASEPVSLSGSFTLYGVDALEKNSTSEKPSLTGKIKFDGTNSVLRFHSWLEGGWDGAVRKPVQDHALFKSYDRVYQRNTPYLEFKEFYATYSPGILDLRAGIQRFAWGRLDEYPPNDLFNPWDYTQFLIKPLEDRKIGVPALSATLSSSDWTYEAVWVPVFVPYRLPMPDERWAGTSTAASIAHSVPQSQIMPQEPNLPDHTVENGSVGLRIKRTGDIEWALNLFHGFDPRPVFKTTALSLVPQTTGVLIDPGYVPDFHKISVLGTDAAAVIGDVSLRAEAAYTRGRYLNILREFWGYPSLPSLGITPLNDAIEQKHDTLDYGLGADYRMFEDGLLTVQGQQTIIFGTTDRLYEHAVETLLWANIKIGWMNQKIETNLSIAYNPEHGDDMVKANAWYIFSDYWKAGVSAITLEGPVQSIFGREARNDELKAELNCSW